ncbi:peptidylprolyl isomerase [Bacillota bacterium Meth-B3]
MNKQTGKLLALLLALALLLSGCGVVKVEKAAEPANTAANANDPQAVVAEFKGGQVLKATIDERFADVVAYYQSFGDELTDPETIKSIKQDLLDIECEKAIERSKADEFKLTVLSDEEKAELTREVTASFEEAIGYYKAYFEDVKTDEEKRQAAIDFLAQQNFTLDGEIEYAIESAWQSKLNEQVTGGVVATPEQIKAAYDDMVAANQETFSASPYDFEFAVASGEKVAWIPEGYRAIKQILLPFTEDQMMKLGDLMAEIDDIQYQLEGGQEEGDLPPEEELEHFEGDGHVHTGDELNLQSDGAAEPTAEPAAEATPEPIVGEPEPADLPDEDFEGEGDAPVLSEAELKAQQAELTRQLDALKAEYTLALKPKVDEIMQKIAAGADFDQLIEEYGEDYAMTAEPGKTEGVYLSAQSEMWEEPVIQAAMALEKPGDISQPVADSSGVHIVRYLRDVPAGPVPMEQLKDTIEEIALSAAKEAHYEETLAKWVAEAEVKTYPERL